MKKIFPILVFVFIVFVFFKSTSNHKPFSPEQAAIQLGAPATKPSKDGIAVMILIDASGSMQDSVKDAGGKTDSKISIARRCVEKTVKQIEGFQKEEPNRTILLGIDSFTALDANKLNQKTIVPLSLPDSSKIAERLQRITPNGGTPIGDAIISASHELFNTSLNRTHILVVTDGENTSGQKPEHVLNAISKLPVESQPHVYFIAFDVSASEFSAMTPYGATVLPAADESQLQASLDMLVGEKILLEK